MRRMNRIEQPSDQFQCANPDGLFPVELPVPTTDQINQWLVIMFHIASVIKSP